MKLIPVVIGISLFLSISNAIAIECPKPELLTGIMVDNQKGHKSVTFEKGETWGINYVYSVYGLNNRGSWGVIATRTLESADIPIIDLDGSEWKRMKHASTGQVHEYFFCHYSANRPLLWAPTTHIGAFWKFDLYFANPTIVIED